MKKLSILTVVAASLILTSVALANEQVISLKDGSQIKGELVGIEKGVYSIKTSSMGLIKIESSKVVSVADASWAATTSSHGGVSSAPTGNAASEINQKISNTQAKILNDPQAMNAIKDMMEDPELMKLLTDPSIAQAAMSHDVKAIENNPKTHELMNNPKMQAFMKQMTEGNENSLK